MDMTRYMNYVLRLQEGRAGKCAVTMAGASPPFALWSLPVVGLRRGLAFSQDGIWWGKKMSVVGARGGGDLFEG
jgi:hypothetical protein